MPSPTLACYKTQNNETMAQLELEGDWDTFSAVDINTEITDGIYPT